jgi:hypothetical protein
MHSSGGFPPRECGGVGWRPSKKWIDYSRRPGQAKREPATVMSVEQASKFCGRAA